MTVGPGNNNVVVVAFMDPIPLLIGKNFKIERIELFQQLFCRFRGRATAGVISLRCNAAPEWLQGFLPMQMWPG